MIQTEATRCLFRDVTIWSWLVPAPAAEKGASCVFGKRVALIERAPYLGGAGINTGTLPSKTLRETAVYFSGLRQRGLYGIDYSLKDGLTVYDGLVTHNRWLSAPFAG